VTAPLQCASSTCVVNIFKCLSEETRLRILNLLDSKPLCVCHIEKILGIGSVRTSQQLAYLKRHGLVDVEIRGTWRVYSISHSTGPEFEAILDTLRKSVFPSDVFQSDRDKLVTESSCL